jgi:hypothetical protein
MLDLAAQSLQFSLGVVDRLVCGASRHATVMADSRKKYKSKIWISPRDPLTSYRAGKGPIVPRGAASYPYGLKRAQDRPAECQRSVEIVIGSTSRVGCRIQLFRINNLEMVAQICPRWNPLTSWMRQIEDFQRAA